MHASRHDAIERTRTRQQRQRQRQCQRQRQRHQRHALGLVLVLASLPPTIAVSVLSSSSSSSSDALILGHDREWWLSRVHLDEDFGFDGSHSDFTQQFYRLFLDRVAVDPPPALEQRDQYGTKTAARVHADLEIDMSDDFHLQKLSPMLQRALLWDLGIVKAGDGEYTQIRTRCGLRMAELAISTIVYESIGCTTYMCSKPTGELYYQSNECNGYQIGNVSQCAASRGKSPVHASMWSTGGDEWTIPETQVFKHEWTEWNATTRYVVYGIHLAGNPNAYRTCVAPSMTVPCIDFEQLSAADKMTWCEPKRSRLVTQWLRAEYAIAMEGRGSSKNNKLLTACSITLSVVLAVVVLWWYFTRYRTMRHRRRFEREREKTLRALEATESEEDGGGDGGFSYFFTDETTRRSHERLRRGIGRDPLATAVLGASTGCTTGFDKAASFPPAMAASTSTSAAASRSTARRTDASFVDGSFQHHDYDDISTRRGGGGGIVGCGAVFAESAASGSRSDGSLGRARKWPSDKSAGIDGPGGDDSRTADVDDDTVLASNTSTYASSMSEQLTPMASHSIASTFGRDSYQITSRSRTHSCSSSASEASPASSSSRLIPISLTSGGPMADLLHDRTVMSKRVPFIDISFSRLLSKGAYGEVWIGRMRDQLVAVKRLVSERRKNPMDLSVFIAEIRLMAQFEHRNVLSLMGVAWNSPGHLCMTMEFMDNGDLRNLMRTRSSQELTWGDRDHATTTAAIASATGGTGKKTSIAIDVVRGLRYLHNLSPKIVHRDLKSNNILLGENLEAKLCDFGVSRVNEGLETMTCGVGTAYWTAPEVLMGNKYTETADVYSFGVVLSELDTHLLPFHDAVDKTTGERLETICIMHLVCMGELGPTLTSHCPQAIRDLALDCMAFEPLERPTPSEIIRRLQTFWGREDGSEESDLSTAERATLASSEEAGASRTCQRLSSPFSVHDHDSDECRPRVVLESSRSNTAAAMVVREASQPCNSREMSTGSGIVDDPPRGSDYSDSGAIWV